MKLCGLTGYMKAEYLAFGQDMLQAAWTFPDLYLVEGAAEKGVSVYAKPSTKAEVTGRFDENNEGI